MLYKKKKRSDEIIINPKIGLTVWVEGPTGREEHICISSEGSSLPLDEYREYRTRLKNLKRREGNQKLRVEPIIKEGVKKAWHLF